MTIFDNDQDYGAFERVLSEAVARHDMRLLAYCLMPNAFHVVLWPREDDELSLFACDSPTGWNTRVDGPQVLVLCPPTSSHEPSSTKEKIAQAWGCTGISSPGA